MLNHTVLFWLDSSLTDDQFSEFLADLKGLGNISVVNQCQVGQPASTPQRPVIDTSYSAALTVLVDDVDAHNMYQVDPIHTAFVNKWKAYFQRVQIYDFQ